MTKIDKINEVIKYSGLSSPGPEVILNRLHMQNIEPTDTMIDMIIKKYKEYILSYRIQNYNTEENFIKTELRLVNLDTFVLAKRFEKSFPMPQTKMTKAMFGDRDFHELYENFKKIQSLMTQKRKDALIKLKKIKDEKNNGIKTD